MKYIYLIAAACTVSFLAPDAAAQRNAYKGTIGYSTPETSIQDGEMVMGVNVDLSHLKLRPQQMVTLTPVLKYEENGNAYEHAFSPVVVAGSVRYKALRREIRFGHASLDNEPVDIVKRHNRCQQYLDMQMSIPLEGWMRRGTLLFEENVTGCAACNIAYAENVLGKNMLPPAFVPVWHPAFEVPAAEYVKARSKTYSATINFVVDRYEILENYKGNAKVLAEAGEIIKEVLDDTNLTFTKLCVDGYASPEGNFKSNMILSDNRAKSFVNYLGKKYSLKPETISRKGHGEDWNGLRAVVEASDMAGKAEVLAIIDGTPDIAARKAKLHALNGGVTYRYMLKTFYPPLRRDDYTISYIARSFTPAEAAEVFSNNPELLSLAEMYELADTYTEGSKEYVSVYETAVKYFPNDAVAVNNLAAVKLQSGNADEAIKMLQGMDSPAALNNLGLAYFMKGDYERAGEYLSRAAMAGNKTAQENIEQYNRWKAEM